MPPLDLKSLVPGGVATTTNPDSVHPLYPSDCPAESYYLTKQDELDWYDRNIFFERKASTKGNSSPTSTSKRYFNFKSKASLIGLGNNYRDRNNFRRNCKPSGAAGNFFPKRSRSVGKSNLPLSEPTSPKVSCIGRVRSKKDRNRKLRLQLKQMESEERRSEKKKKTALWKTLKAALNLGGQRKSQKDAKTSPEEMMATATNARCKEWLNQSANELGGLKRFTSGRRPDSWGGCDVVDSDVEGCEWVEERSVWSRRGVGPVEELRIDRDWEDVGPASV